MYFFYSCLTLTIQNYQNDKIYYLAPFENASNNFIPEACLLKNVQVFSFLGFFFVTVNYHYTRKTKGSSDSNVDIIHDKKYFILLFLLVSAQQGTDCFCISVLNTKFLKWQFISTNCMHVCVLFPLLSQKTEINFFEFQKYVSLECLLTIQSSLLFLAS